MTDEPTADDDAEQNDELPNPPGGETTDRPFDDEEVRDLLRGAELLRYTPGTGKHSGNVMAVFRTPDGEGIGVTMNDDSDTPEDLIGEQVARERPFVRGSGVSHGKAYILFEDRDRATEKIIVRNTQAIGLYEVEVENEEDEPALYTDGGVSYSRVEFTLPENHYYARTKPGNPVHIFDEEERRSLCGRYNSDGVTSGPDRTGTPKTCEDCVEEASYLKVAFEGAEDVQVEDMVAAVEESDAHPDLKAYVRKAYDRGGTPLLNSMRYLVSVHGVENGVARWYELGNRIETTLYENGAGVVLDTCGNVDTTNSAILKEVVEERA